MKKFRIYLNLELIRIIWKTKTNHFFEILVSSAFQVRDIRVRVSIPTHSSLIIWVNIVCLTKLEYTCNSTGFTFAIYSVCRGVGLDLFMDDPA